MIGQSVPLEAVNLNPEESSQRKYILIKAIMEPVTVYTDFKQTSKL